MEKPRSAGNARGPRWPGPPGLTLAQKKRWSEKQRRAAFTTEERTAVNNARRDRSAHEDPNKPRDRKRERRFRDRQTEEGLHQIDNAASIVNALNLRRPNYLYIERNGQIHQEEWETADELVRRMRKAQDRAAALSKVTTERIAKANSLWQPEKKKEKAKA